MYTYNIIILYINAYIAHTHANTCEDIQIKSKRTGELGGPGGPKQLRQQIFLVLDSLDVFLLDRKLFCDIAHCTNLLVSNASFLVSLFSVTLLE